MSSGVPREVYTADELARAALVEPSLVRARIAAGHVPLIPGTRFIAAGDAVRIGREPRAAAVAAVAVMPLDLFDRTAHPPKFADARDGARLLASACVYVVLAAILLLRPSAPGRSPS